MIMKCNRFCDILQFSNLSISLNFKVLRNILGGSDLLYAIVGT